MSFISEYIFSILIGFFIILILLLIKRQLDYFSSIGFPYIKPTLLGTIKSLSMSHLVTRPPEIYEDEQKKGSLCVGFYHSILKPAVLLVDPSLVESILIRDFSHFSNHGIDIDTKRDPLAGHLFNMNGDQWRTLRHKLLPTFTSGKLKGMIPAMNDCAEKLVGSMKQDSSLRKEVNFKELFRIYSLSVIASCVFAIDPESIKDPKCEFRQLLERVTKPTPIMMFKTFMLLSFPKLAKFFRIKFIPYEIENFFIKLTKDALETRKSTGIKRNDFIQLLLELKEKGSVGVDTKDLEEDEKTNVQQVSNTQDHKLEITDELLSAQTFVFIVAGFGNTAYLASIALYFLSKNKDIQAKVRSEIRNALNKHGNMNYMALKDMQLLDGSINEAIRILPSLIILFRKCNKDYTLRNGVTIKKGMDIMISTKALQNDPRYWPDPEKFDPERFINGHITPGTYLPFGDGPRICIAQRLALLMVKIVLAKIIINYEVEPSMKTKEPLIPPTVAGGDVKGGIWGSFEPVKEQ